MINSDDGMHSGTKLANLYLSKYEKAKNLRENFVPLFEECYEYSLPQRESFYAESVGQRRDDKIFDETAVVGVQEFASRLQSGLVPNFARWADFTAGSEVPKEQKDEINNELDEVTDYVFEVIQNSNFGQEVHESFMDLAVGTGVLNVAEGDACTLLSSQPYHYRMLFLILALMITLTTFIVSVRCVILTFQTCIQRQTLGKRYNARFKTTQMNALRFLRLFVGITPLRTKTVFCFMQSRQIQKK